MPKIVYLNHYDYDNTRISSPAGCAMADYVAEAMVATKVPVIMVSSAPPNGRDAMDRIEVERSGYKLIFPKTLRRYKYKYHPLNILRKIYYHFSLKRELINILDDGDVLATYHSLDLMRVVRAVRRKKRVKFILHTCEIYTNVVENASDLSRRREISFIKSADAYIFSTNMLEQQLNTRHMPYAVCLGTYRNEHNRCEKHSDGKIHVVYAGTFDTRKGGVAAALSAATLDSGYHVHILGFGTAAEVEAVKAKVAEVNAASDATVSYDGCLRGEDYIRFIQSCDIGLSTQNPDAAFSATSFPSKILSYMANGLQVVSIDIPAISTSAVGGFVKFYKEQSAENIAAAIKAVDLSKADNPRDIINNLDSEFKKNLAEVIFSVSDGGVS